MSLKMEQYMVRMEHEQNEGTLDLEQEITNIRRLVSLGIKERFPTQEIKAFSEVLDGLKQLKINQVRIQDGEFFRL